VRTRQLFAEGVAKAGKFDLSTDPAFKDAAGKYGFVSGKSTHADRLATIKDTFERFDQMIDTHTADGVKVAREHLGAEPMLVLETALPIKFAATIEEALGRQPDRPAKFNGIEDLPKRVVVMAPTWTRSRPLSPKTADKVLRR
jgi:threonine synthase